MSRWANNGHYHCIIASLRWPMIRRFFGAPRSMKIGTTCSLSRYDFLAVCPVTPTRALIRRLCQYEGCGASNGKTG
jgi:hypothetical protein